MTSQPDPLAVDDVDRAFADRLADLAGTTPVFTAEHTSDAWGRRQVTLTLATTMANTRLAGRPPVPVLHVKVNAVDLRDLAASLIEAADEADRLDADMTPRLGPCQVCTPIAEAATSALAERVRVVEGERDQLLRERDNIGCSRFTCASNLDNMRARAESAEAAHADLRAGVEALADEYQVTLDTSSQTARDRSAVKFVVAGSNGWLYTHHSLDGREASE